MADSPLELGEIRLVPSANEGMTRVVVSGEIDLASRDRLGAIVEAIAKGPAQDVVADLDAVTFLGSVGLDFLVRLQLRTTNAGRRLIVLNPSPAALAALQASGLDAVLTILGTPPTDG